MFRIRANFIGRFKTGDNINYNLTVLAFLYSLRQQANDTQRNLLNKPIFIALMSITEAVLHDFHLRIKSHTSEGVTNLASVVIDYIRGKNIDELEKYIVSARKHNLFSMADQRFYDILDGLRKVRNRIHIQNKDFMKPADEIDVFTEQKIVQAEAVLEKIMRVMEAKYPRAAGADHFVNDFNLPWVERFPQRNP